jgi:hypothetical protein
MNNSIFLISLLFCSSAFSVESVSSYTKVNDKKKCAYKPIDPKNVGSESCEYLCDGPIKGIKTKLLSCSDYEHFYFQLDQNWYSTWTAMTSVGNFSGLGNKNGLVEWVFKDVKEKKREDLIGLIVRFNGVDGDGRNVNSLSSFKVEKSQICWLGNFNDNLLARRSFGSAKCKEILLPEKMAQ